MSTSYLVFATAARYGGKWVLFFSIAITCEWCKSKSSYKLVYELQTIFLWHGVTDLLHFSISAAIWCHLLCLPKALIYLEFFCSECPDIVIISCFNSHLYIGWKIFPLTMEWLEQKLQYQKLIMGMYYMNEWGRNSQCTTEELSGARMGFSVNLDCFF